jgi:hypothetical protein
MPGRPLHPCIRIGEEGGGGMLPCPERRKKEEKGTTPLDPAAAAGGSLQSAPSLAEEGGPDRRADRGAPPASLLRLGSRPTRPRVAR